MRKISIVIVALSLLFSSSFVLAENELVFSKRYSRGDDDLAYSYRTAFLEPSLRLTKAKQGYSASITFMAHLSTPEAQGFAESVRFGMREANRSFQEPGKSGFTTAKFSQTPVVFKFMQNSNGRWIEDYTTQRLADQLSNNALRTRSAVPGNRNEALNKWLGGTLNLGTLGEGTHKGTIFVQQLVGMTPSNQDTDISVRHLITWEVKVSGGKIGVEIQNNRYYATDAVFEITAPSWNGSVRPHRVELLRDSVSIDGKSYLNGKAQYGRTHSDKGTTLLNIDKSEFRKEYTLKERIQIRRQQKSLRKRRKE